MEKVTVIGGGNEGGKACGDTYIIRVRVREFLRTC